MADASAPKEPPERERRRIFWPGGLSARLLVLTVLFALLGGLIAIPPALSAYERQWLLDRVRAAELASLAPEVAPDRVVSEQLKTQLLRGAGVEIVAISVDGVRSLVFAGARPAEAPYVVDLRPRAAGLGLFAPFRTIFGPEGRRVRVVAEPRFRAASAGRFVLVGAGGIGSGAEAYAKLRAGASAVQLYSALAFEGPGLVIRIKRELAERLRADGFRSVAEAVGTG